MIDVPDTWLLGIERAGWSLHDQTNMKNLRQLYDGDVTKWGDFIKVTESRYQLLSVCKYDPGCCTGVVIGSQDCYYRYQVPRDIDTFKKFTEHIKKRVN